LRVAAMTVVGKAKSRESRFPQGERDNCPHPISKRLSRIGFGLAVVCVTAQTVAHVVDLWLLDRDLPVLELNTNENPFNWLPAVTILVAGIGLFQLNRARRGSPVLRITALLLAYLAIDDALELHYRVPYWPIVYLPLFALVGWSLWSLSSASPGPSGRILKAGLASLVVAFLLDIIAPPLLERGGWDAGEWPHELKVILKEGAQLAGWMLIAFGVIAVYVGLVRDRTPTSDGHSATRAPASPRA
jgi:hypothetical protein